MFEEHNFNEIEVSCGGKDGLGWLSLLGSSYSHAYGVDEERSLTEGL